jgi:hypothetical protein
MAERKVTSGRWSRIQRILKNAVVAEKGQIACIDTADGSLTVAAVSTTLVPIGFFEQSFTGDGVKVMSVKLFAEIDVQLFTASATGTPVDADVGKICYLRATPEVSTTATSSSVAGRIWGVTTAGVWVQMFGNGAAVS